MKIAMPNNGNLVNQHFGKSKSFVIVTVEDKNIMNIEEVSTAELLHQHQGLADLLQKNGVNVVITGGIGGGALAGLQRNNFEVIRGASGDYKAVVEEYVNGNLKSKGEICKHHDEEHHGHRS